MMTSEDNQDFVATLGVPMTAHLLRRLSERFVDDYAAWLPEAGVTAPARSLSTLLLLADKGPLGVTELAARLRLSHPLLIKLAALLERQGLVAIGVDSTDARRRPLALTDAGRNEAKRIRDALAVLDRAFAELSAETGADLFAAIERTNAACTRESFQARLRRLAEG